MRSGLLLIAVLSVSACAQREAGFMPASSTFGVATSGNDLAQHAELQRGRYLVEAGVRFSEAAPDTVEFAFNRADLSPAARKALDAQAAWLSANPDIRMSVTGHTDLVGGEAFNQKLGLRRAQAAARYLVARGIAADRVEAVESRGESEPKVDTDEPEAKNRRAVTSVAGFTHGYLGDNGDGRRARLIYQRYATDSVEEPAEASSTSGSE